MAVKLRLQRFGTVKRPFYRLVAADSKFKRDGRYLEIIGTYDPRQNPSVVQIEEDRALEWLKKGAQPTTTVKNILREQGVLAKYREDKKAQ